MLASLVFALTRPFRNKTSPDVITCVNNDEGVASDVVRLRAIIFDEMITCPFDDDVIVMFSPAAMYDVPSVSLVSDPLRPALCFVAPVNVVPETVATTLSLIEAVTPVLAPPSTKLMPVPATKARSALRFALFPMVTYASSDAAKPDAAMVTPPFDADVTAMLLPAIR